MGNSLKILMLEDSLLDAELILGRLEEPGLKITHGLGDCETDMRRMLSEDEWDIVLCDYSMPNFNPYEALKILKELHLDIPFIVISGAVGEENVIKLMKAGCNDCIMKDNMTRLPHVVKKEIEEAQVRKENRVLRERLNKYQILAENSNDAIFFLDQDGNILEVNAAARKSYGYTYEEFLHMTVFDLRHATNREYVAEQLKKADMVGLMFETTHFLKDGTEIAVEVSSQGSFLDSKRIIISIVRNITERKLAEAELIKAKEKAEAANEARKQFLANMSHEIRTPLNGLMGMIQIMQMTELSEEQKKFMRISKSSADALLIVINDILDYSKMEAGKMGLERITFSLKKVLNDAVSMFRIASSEKGIELNESISEEVPDDFIGDPFRLRQILSNLIGNAVKYTKQGSIDVHVDLVETLMDHKCMLKFDISDTGIGIPEDKMEVLFKSFSQVDNSDTRKYGGTGLGLAISKKLVELMNGEIEVKSVFGKGSHFSFTCKLEVSDIVAGTDEYSVSNMVFTNVGEVKEKPLRLLLVEDDAVSRTIFEQLAMKKNWDVTLVRTGREAVDIFDKETFDVILMDLQMPVMDGFVATKIIRQLEENTDRRTPIIALTAKALAEDEKKCFEAGMDDFISKPINVHKFYDTIEKWIHNEKA